MSKLQNVWVIAESESAIRELSAGAVALGEKSALVIFEKPDSMAVVISAIVATVKKNQPDLVLVESSKNGRLIAGLIAAAMGTSPLSDICEISVDSGAVVTKRMVYGGMAFKTERAVGGTVIAVCCTGLFEAGESVTGTVNMVLENSTGIRFKEKKLKEGKTVNLATSKKVVSVGRGLGKAANLELVKSFASLLGADIGCTRPVAEEEKLLPKEFYIGVSGVMMKPELYIGIGVSGQIQHMVGVSQALTVVAVNKDKNAPIFKQCDYGIVGDLEKVIPALMEKFRA